jgi:uncharacterized protein HemY
MSSGLLSLIFALGVAGWVYSITERRVGVSNTKTSVAAAIIAFVISLVFFFSLTKFVIHM